MLGRGVFRGYQVQTIRYARIITSHRSICLMLPLRRETEGTPDLLRAQYPQLSRSLWRIAEYVLSDFIENWSALPLPVTMTDACYAVAVAA